MASHYVYMYRKPSGMVMYVGYGKDLARALSHAGGSPNQGLAAWLARGDFTLSVAGPYRDQTEGRHVEAALISSLDPELNRVPGDGPKFVPVGVPPALGERPTLAALRREDVGIKTEGALLVYLAPGEYLDDGRRKFDPAEPDDNVIRSNIEGVWDLQRHLEDWRSAPSNGPRVLIGVHGKPRHRFIVAAAAIDTTRWGDPTLKASGSSRWRVPLREPVDLDAHELRGRRVDDVRFGQFSWQLHIWVDGTGATRHPAVESSL